MHQKYWIGIFFLNIILWSYFGSKYANELVSYKNELNHSMQKYCDFIKPNCVVMYFI